MEAAGRRQGSFKPSHFIYMGPGLCSVPKHPVGTGGLSREHKGTVHTAKQVSILSWFGISFMRALVMQTHRCSLRLRHQEISQERICAHSKVTPLEERGPKG